MSSCNNNSGVTTIYVSQPCDPCNPCSTCNRCACSCTCEPPTYETAGCVSIQPSSCIKYDGPPIPDQNILLNDTLTKVIQNLAAAINGTPLLAPKPVTIDLQAAHEEHVAKTDAFTTDIDYRTQGISNRIDALKTQIEDGGLLSDVQVVTDDIVEINIDDKNLIASINFDNLIDGLLDAVKTNPSNASKVAQLFDYLKNTHDFVLYPYEVSASSTSTGNSIIVSWSAVEDVASYSVYYKAVTDGNFIKVGETPSLGITVPNLTSATEYQVYIVSNGHNGKQSANSPIVSVTTN